MRVLVDLISKYQDNQNLQIKFKKLIAQKPLYLDPDMSRPPMYSMITQLVIPRVETILLRVERTDVAFFQMKKFDEIYSYRGTDRGQIVIAVTNFYLKFFFSFFSNSIFLR